jgi:catechol 2,3-dioxygenase-like lactoylglutathione lyase family enzyme
MICREPDRLAEFYETAFGFLRTDDTSITEPAYATLMRLPEATARIITLQLRDQEIMLAAIQPAGRDYPRAVSGRNPLFQHFAIVASDMSAAYARLSACAGWQTISTDGPQLLPASSGGATAYKFRDPEGHPLELIAFARDATPAMWQETSITGCLGIDHSAISVADTERSVQFYGSLGLRRTGGSLNAGPAQDRLDDVASAIVEVTSLGFRRVSAPHIELLSYRSGCAQETALPNTNDVAATRLVLAVAKAELLEALCAQSAHAVLSGPVRFEDGVLRAMLRDPDGHLLCLEAPRNE